MLRIDTLSHARRTQSRDLLPAFWPIDTRSSTLCRRSAQAAGCTQGVSDVDDSWMTVARRFVPPQPYRA
ncbi:MULTISPECIES: hypothetical protein [unclassified Xanthomonas]|uniref:hypothetical protein n=1 Tax=unclassified Xanthomonas TaxID=2643310 RepID=UPI002A7FFAE2|nr:MULTISPECIES: hypothetical protein [unclassified Xanthomonas]MDY4295990.1 hypothetical protein [Xanthomonas sp. LF02-5]MDY4357785.1 hypothetical protein [Xanthomonas sp. LF04-12]